MRWLAFLLGVLFTAGPLLGVSRSAVGRDAADKPALAGERSQITSWPAPAEEAISEDYQLTLDGRPAPVYSCRVSAMPFDQVWPGYQRPLEQTEIAAFAYWDMQDPARVEIRCRRAVRSAVVRPSSYGITPLVEGNRISLTLDHPRLIVVEVNGSRNALHLFASPPQTQVPQPNTPGLRYFGPGIHRPGRITLASDETVYIAGGAVVYGSIHARGAANIRIGGRGILDVSPFQRGKGGGAVRLADCSGITIEGIVIRDPDVWCCSLFGCREATISNIKLIGLWRYNADGIDLCNTQHATVRDCFIRSFDDSIVLKGLKNPFDNRPLGNLRIRGCVIWNDWGRALEIGAETCAPEISDVVFEDCDIIRTTHVAIDIQHGDRAVVRNIRFEDIRVEVDEHNPRPLIQNGRDDTYQPKQEDDYCPRLFVIDIRPTNYSQDDQRGNVRDILFRDILVTGARMPESVFRGFDAEHTVEDVTIQNLRFQGRSIENAEEARLAIGRYVKNVRLEH